MADEAKPTTETKPTTDETKPFELSKNKKKAYGQLMESMRGRKESDIGLDDGYWEIKREVQKAESSKLFTEPDEPPPTETKPAEAAPKSDFEKKLADVKK